VGDKYILKRSFQSSSSALQDRRWKGESSFNKKFNPKTKSYDNRSSFRGNFNKDNSGGYDRRGDSFPPKRSRKVTEQLDGPYRVKDYEKYENKNNVDHLKPVASNELTINDFSGDAIQSMDWQEKKSATGKPKNNIFVNMDDDDDDEVDYDDDDDDWEDEELEPEQEIKRIPPKKKSSLNDIPVFDDEGRELRGKQKVKLIEEIREDDFSDGDLDEDFEPKSTRFNRNMASASSLVEQKLAPQNKNKNPRKTEQGQPPARNRGGATTSRDSRGDRNPRFDEQRNRRTTEAGERERGDRQDNNTGIKRERKVTMPRLEGEEQEWVNPDRESKNKIEEQQQRGEENDRTSIDRNTLSNNKNKEVNPQEVLERRERRFEESRSPSRRSGYNNNNNNNNNFERDNRDREGNNYRGASNRNPSPRRDGSGGGREGRVAGGGGGDFEPEYGNYEGDHLYGISPILAALRSRRRKMEQLIIQSDLDGMAEKKKDGSAVEEILRLAKEQNIEIRQFNKYLLNNLSGQRPHQGFILRAKPLEFSPLEELKDWRTETNIFSTKKP
jgi:hypothetical protein